MSQREALPGRPALADLQQIDAVCDRFEVAWRNGRRPDMAEFLAEVPANVRAQLLSRPLEPGSGIPPPARRATGCPALL